MISNGLVTKNDIREYEITCEWNKLLLSECGATEVYVYYDLCLSSMSLKNSFK